MRPVTPLVRLLRTGANVKVKIYAARALTHMMEAPPSSSSATALNGAAGPLCQNLLSLEYIDLAEQSLSALHKLSVDYPQQNVSANGFEAVLSFIDFFSIGVQRMAAATACNLCRQPRGDAMEMISRVLPNTMRLLSFEEQRIRESDVVGFTKLAEAYRSSPEKLEALCGDALELIEKVLSLIVPPSPPALSPQSYSSALRFACLLSWRAEVPSLDFKSWIPTPSLCN
ncbi:Armadillo-like helical domain containing protein [Gracilaria domingensis]|nr:Armadillo-like helical domain containing protein [Gracilaria domingensis]